MKLLSFFVLSLLMTSISEAHLLAVDVKKPVFDYEISNSIVGIRDNPAFLFFSELN